MVGVGAARCAPLALEHHRVGICGRGEFSRRLSQVFDESHSGTAMATHSQHQLVVTGYALGHQNRIGQIRPLRSRMWTKTSLPPSSGWIKPCPLSGLNHFTAPVATSFSGEIEHQ
jgi:hypothetical protein